MNPAERLFRHLADSIESGSLAVGRPLPKVLFLTREFHASPRTVVRALARLVEEGFAHKRGKSFYAGKPPAKTAAGRKPRTLFLVEKDVSAWEKLNNPRTGPFLHAFEQEAQRFQVRVVPLPISGQPGFFGLFDPSRFSSLAKSMGGGFLGALVIGSRAELPGLPSILESLGQSAPKVLWFDRYDEGWTPPQRKNIFRHHYSESKGLSAALEGLVRLGHRRIAYTGIVEEPWMAARLEKLRALCAGISPRPEILSFPFCDAYWRVIAGKAPSQAEAEAIPAAPAEEWKAWMERNREGHPHLYRPETVQAVMEWMSRPRETGPLSAKIGLDEIMVLLAPQMRHLLENSPCTALLAPHDWQGRKYLSFLHYAGVRIPEKFSLLSFDNHRSRYWQPLSSIDFGFGHLGYCALHHLLGDLDFRMDAQQSLAGIPELLDRGSIGPPRSPFPAPQSGKPGARETR